VATWRGHCARRVDRSSTELGIPYVSISVQGSCVQSNAHGVERIGRLTKVTSWVERRQKSAHKIPMPRVSPKPRSWVFQWLELEPFSREPNLTTVGE